MYVYIYNVVNIKRAVIGRCSWSIRVQTQMDWFKTSLEGLKNTTSQTCIW